MEQRAGKEKGRSTLFQDFQALLKICSHPWTLNDKNDSFEEVDQENDEDLIKEFIESNEEHLTQKNTSANVGESSMGPSKENIEERTWWKSECTEEDIDNTHHSGKLMILLSLLVKCEIYGDKLLLFSQSLSTLNMIERFLYKIDESQNSEFGKWKPGIDYFRLDGSKDIEERSKDCHIFNDPNNSRARYLFAIKIRILPSDKK